MPSDNPIFGWDPSCKEERYLGFGTVAKELQFSCFGLMLTWTQKSYLEKLPHSVLSVGLKYFSRSKEEFPHKMSVLQFISIF